MKNADYTFSFNSTKSTEEIFRHLLDVRSWWSGLFGEDINGDSNAVGDEFTFVAGNNIHRTRHRLITLDYGKKIVWQVVDSELSFVDKKDEWTGTKTSFQISRIGELNQVTFSHQGLSPDLLCYDSCSGAWNQYLEKLAIDLK